MKLVLIVLATVIAVAKVVIFPNNRKGNVQMKELQKQLDMLFKQSGGDESVIEVIKKEKAVFPFSTEGRMLAYLLATQTITYDKYMELQNEYATI